MRRFKKYRNVLVKWLTNKKVYFSLAAFLGMVLLFLSIFERSVVLSSEQLTQVVDPRERPLLVSKKLSMNEVSYMVKTSYTSWLYNIELKIPKMEVERELKKLQTKGVRISVEDSYFHGHQMLT